MEKTINQYIRRGGKKVEGKTNKVGGRKVGYFYAAPVDEKTFGIGWSLCKTKADKFDEDVAFEIAFDREKKNFMRYNTGDESAKLKFFANLPKSIEKDFNAFVARCKRYYKGMSFIYE